MEYITVIRPEPKRALAKTISKKDDGTFKIGGYNSKALHYSSEMKEVENVHTLGEALEEIQKDSSAAVIRGQLVHGINPQKHKRRMISNKEDGAYEDIDQHWVMIDMDKIPLAMIGFVNPMEKPDEAIIKLRDLLPPIFKAATCWWQFSGSQGFRSKEDTVSAHLWFWLDQKVPNHKLKMYFEFFNESCHALYGTEKNLVDCVLFHSIQLHYTAKPVLLDEIEDQLPKRSGFLDGGTDTVIWSEDWAGYQDEDGEGYWKFLNAIGDNGRGTGNYHYPIMQAIGSYISVSGEMNEVKRKELKILVRDAVEAASIKGDRPEEEIARYKSDNFLDMLIDGAIRKGYDKRIISSSQMNDLMEDYMYVQATDTFYDKKRKVHLTERVFNNTHLEINGGKPLSRMLLTDPNFKKVYAVYTIPGDREEYTIDDGSFVYNNWNGRPIEPAPEAGDVSTFIEHLDYLVDYNRDARRHLERYLAHIIRNPGKKIHHAIIVGSEKEGTGKSYLKFMLGHVIGYDNLKTVGTDQLKEQYNGWVEEAEVLIIEELMSQGRLSIAERLKTIITESKVTVRRMRTDSYEVKNYSNIIAFTNHRNAMVLSKHNRRYWVWFSDADIREPSYYKHLFNWTKDNAANIYRWALDYDLTDFDIEAPPPETDAKKEMVELAVTPLEDFFTSRIEEEKWPFKCDLIIISDLVDQMPGKFAHTSTVKVSEMMRKLGCVQIGQKRFSDGSKPRVWSIRNHENYKKMNSKELEKHYFKPLDPNKVLGVDSSDY